MKRWALILLAALGTVGFIALGVWQLERREWKLALIERVDQRVHAQPVPAPPPSEWPALSRESSEYLRVTATGRFLPGRETLVQATTILGRGFWVLAPLQTDTGFTVLVNRGFVLPEQREASTRPDAATSGETVTVTGLVRMTEPGGGFLRANAPDENRWYSRDVAAIAREQNLKTAAPYFIDAEAGANGGAPDRPPVGGLTVLKFRNTHLTYAFTWFTLALMTAAFGAYVARQS